MSPKWFGFESETWFWTDWANTSIINDEYAQDYTVPTFEEWADNNTIYNPVPGTNVDQYILLSLVAYILYKLK